MGIQQGRNRNKKLADKIELSVEYYNKLIPFKDVILDALAGYNIHISRETYKKLADIYDEIVVPMGFKKCCRQGCGSNLFLTPLGDAYKRYEDDRQ